jgi:hypothetical protein
MPTTLPIFSNGILSITSLQTIPFVLPGITKLKPVLPLGLEKDFRNYKFVGILLPSKKSAYEWACLPIIMNPTANVSDSAAWCEVDQYGQKLLRHQL